MWDHLNFPSSTQLHVLPLPRGTIWIFLLRSCLFFLTFLCHLVLIKLPRTSAAACSSSFHWNLHRLIASTFMYLRSYRLLRCMHVKGGGKYCVWHLTMFLLWPEFIFHHPRWELRGEEGGILGWGGEGEGGGGERKEIALTWINV